MKILDSPVPQNRAKESLKQPVRPHTLLPATPGRRPTPGVRLFLGCLSLEVGAPFNVQLDASTMSLPADHGGPHPALQKRVGAERGDPKGRRAWRGGDGLGGDCPVGPETDGSSLLPPPGL